ncbi:MAG TPA: AAA family ATPase [Actinomycetota bacterium]|jgi:energy-coupling factor transporter ATP-binding protein EcfA2|nr:AAA family ATPase [Actinomycetota bacterium]
MDLSGRPLLDTKTDHELFADRGSELERLLTSVDRGLNVLVVGERGSGKTTLLRQLAYELRQHSPDNLPAFVEGRLSEDVRTFLDLVRYRLGLKPPSKVEATLALMTQRAALDDTLELPRMVGSLREATSGGRRAVLVDELPVGSIGQTLFGRLRDELWQLPLTWVVAVSENEAGPLRSPPADAFFDFVIRLEPLSRDAQRAILEARAGPSGNRIASQIDEGNPRRLLALAREALEGGAQPPDLVRALNRRDAEVSKLGRAASMLMAELESLGPTSASDERLLSRLGWTRTRAVQVLRQLEEKGLVTSSTAKGESGRPRKLYRPADPVREVEPRDVKA